jgi:hypothetical protein
MERDKLMGSNPTMLVAVPGYLASGGQLDSDFSDLLAGGSLVRTQPVRGSLIRNLNLESQQASLEEAEPKAEKWY